MTLFLVHSDLYDVSIKQQVKTPMNAEITTETADSPHEIQSQMQRMDDQSALMQQNISPRQHEILPDNSSAIYDDVELSVLTTQPNASGSLFSGSDLLKLNTDTLDTSLPVINSHIILVFMMISFYFFFFSLLSLKQALLEMMR